MVAALIPYLDNVGRVHIQVGEHHGDPSSVLLVGVADAVGADLVVRVLRAAVSRGGQRAVPAVQDSVATCRLEITVFTNPVLGE